MKNKANNLKFVLAKNEISYHARDLVIHGKMWALKTHVNEF